MGLAREADPTAPVSWDDHPFLHGPALPGVEVAADSASDQLIDALSGQFRHEFAPDEHGKDLAVNFQHQVACSPTWLDDDVSITRERGDDGFEAASSSLSYYW